MKKICAWLLLPFFFAISLATLITWDILLKILQPIHKGIHKRVLDTGIHLLLIHLRLLGTRIQVVFHAELPTDTPMVVISNHQSVFDIPLLMWHLRHYSPVFVAKHELGKWIPSVSYTLRTNGSVLIDRKDPAQSIPAIRSLGAYINQRKIAACIFPEGTRSRDGQLRKFKSSGVMTLLEGAPHALVIPVAISGSWNLVRHSLLPIPLGVQIFLDVLPALNPQVLPTAELVALAEEQIRKQVLARC